MEGVRKPLGATHVRLAAEIGCSTDARWPPVSDGTERPEVT
jgi:hypothetical protein